MLVGLPATIVGFAYLCLAIEHGTLWLFPVVVHENGRYSLTETVFYFRHFLREIPIDIIYGLSSVGAMRTYGPAAVLAEPGARSPWPPVVCAAVILAIAWIGSAREWGHRVAFDDLMQRSTRDDLSDYGSHWRFHLLSSAAYLGCAVGLSSLAGRILQGRAPAPRPVERTRWMVGTLAAMAALTLMFRPTLEPLTDPRYLGHQLREAVTQIGLMLPLALGAILAQTRPSAALAAAAPSRHILAGDRPGPASAREHRRVPREIAAWQLSGLLIVAFLAIATTMTGAVSSTSPGVPLSSLVCAHVFEHLLDYVFVALLSIGLTRAAAERPGHTRPSSAGEASRLP